MHGRHFNPFDAQTQKLKPCDIAMTVHNSLICNDGQPNTVSKGFGPAMRMSS